MPPEVPEDELDPFTDDPVGDDADAAYRAPARPPWWRLVAIVIVIAMVVATPFAYALHIVFR